jgi:O-acetylhomoserine (thiol)-lyase
VLVSTQPESADGFDTRQVHAGEVDERNHGARITPIYLTAAYRFDSFAQAEDRFTGAETVSCTRATSI